MKLNFQLSKKFVFSLSLITDSKLLKKFSVVLKVTRYLETELAPIEFRVHHFISKKIILKSTKRQSGRENKTKLLIALSVLLFNLTTRMIPLQIWYTKKKMIYCIFSFRIPYLYMNHPIHCT